MLRVSSVIGCGLLALAMGLAAPGVSGAALAGTGKFFPTYHPPKTCTDGECKGDDPRSELPCQGLLCGLASAKSLQPPVTAAQANEAARAHAAVTDAPVPPTVESVTTPTDPKRSVKRVAKAKTLPDKTPAEKRAPPPAAEAAAR